MSQKPVRYRMASILAAVALACAALACASPATSTVALAAPEPQAQSQPQGAAEVAPVEGRAQAQAPNEVVTALSSDERRIVFIGKGEAFDDAARVIFHVWQPALGPQSLIRHEAVRQADGSWTAMTYVATNDYHGQGIPYNCQVTDAVHRLYNANTSQHLFTADADEADALSRTGWNYEGVAWVHPAATSGAKAGAGEQPVYRLYNPYSGDHFLTLDRSEYDSLPGSGWRQEGVAFSSPAAPTAGEDATGIVTVYRLYNPYLTVGSHHFTTSLNEYETLKADGWTGEGVAWYGVGTSPDGNWSAEAQGRYHDAAGDYRVEAHVIPFAEVPEPAEPEVTVPDVTDPEPTDPDAADAKEPGATDSEATDPNDESADTSGDATDEEHSTTPADGTGSESDASDSSDSTDSSDATDAGDSSDTADTPADDSPSDTDAEAAEPPAPKPDPSREFVAGTSGFTVSRPTASAHVENVNDAKGTFDVVVDGISSPSGVASVHVPTWTVPNGQDDLVWYEAARQGDGSYRASVNIGRHTFDHDFTSHVYLIAGNGLMVNAVQLDQHLSLANFLNHANGPEHYLVSIYNPGDVGRVQMGAWSDVGGKDDLVWYNARNEGNGWWSTVVESTRLAHSGLVHVDIFADGEFRGAVELTVQPWEILTGPYRAMYNRIYDLASPTRWLIAVDTTNCFVGVFEGERGNWQNRFWWSCAPGAYGTPTVKGIFSIGSRGYVFGNGFSCYYWTQFYGDYLFHSIQYYPGTFSVMDGTLGRPKSHGCVRLALENARWINQNIPSGTTVLSY